MSDRYTVNDCREPWKTLQILSTGEVRVCCWSRQSVGKLSQNTLEEIWEGEGVKSIRSHIEQGLIHPFCKNAACPYIQNYRK